MQGAAISHAAGDSSDQWEPLPVSNRMRLFILTAGGLIMNGRSESFSLSLSLRLSMSEWLVSSWSSASRHNNRHSILPRPFSDVENAQWADVADVFGHKVARNNQHVHADRIHHVSRLLNFKVCHER